MELIAVAVPLWLWTLFYAQSIDRPAKQEWIMQIQLRRWFRCLIAAVVSAGVLFAFAGLMLAILPIRLPPSISDFDRLDYIGVALCFSACSTFPWLFLRYGSIVATRTELHFLHLSLRWSDITKVERDPLHVKIRVPERRRAWNLWSGDALLSRWMWALSDEAVDRLDSLHRELQRSGG